jgi:hypothetical protein
LTIKKKEKKKRKKGKNEKKKVSVAPSFRCFEASTFTGQRQRLSINPKTQVFVLLSSSTNQC